MIGWDEDDVDGATPVHAANARAASGAKHFTRQ
jgi:hypothetical protein